MIHVVSNPMVQVPLDQITVSRANARSFYDPDGLKEMTHSLQGKFGQLYPVLLRRIRPERYELFMGSRRLKAARKAEWPTIGAVILDDISDPEMIVLSLEENLHRRDMTPFEEAKAFLMLCKEHSMSLKDVANRVKKPVAFVKGRLKLLSVPDQVQDLLCRNRLTLNHVGILACLGNPRDQIRYAKIVAKQALSEEDLTTLIQEEAATTTTKERPASRRLFTPMRTALKVKRFTKFLRDKVRPQLALEGSEVTEIRKALREVRNLVNDLLGRSKKVVS